MADAKFEEFAQARIRRIHTHRAEVLKKSNASRLKNSPFQRLDEQGLMTVKFLREEYPKIENKTSTHSAGTRQLIATIVENALLETLTFYEQQNPEGAQ